MKIRDYFLGKKQCQANSLIQETFIPSTYCIKPRGLKTDEMSVLGAPLWVREAVREAVRCKWDVLVEELSVVGFDRETGEG